jgi:hypothetical protein
MVSQLLYDLPAGEQYRIIFMERDLDEVLASQEKMLARLGRNAAPRDEMKRAFSIHLERLGAWLAQQDHVRLLRVNYRELIEGPRQQAQRVREFLDGNANAERMMEAVDLSLYRNRKTAAEQPAR